MKIAWTWMAAATLLVLCGAPLRGAEALAISFVEVGDPGNQPFDFSAIGWRNIGRVGYAFRIGKYETSRAQYLVFLNTVDPQGVKTDRLSSRDFVLDAAQPAGQRYRLAEEGPALPVRVSWYAAARFCNWLHHGQGGPGTEEGDASSGAYDTRNFDDAEVANDPAGRNPGAKFWLPSEDEWVKAAHYKGGGTAAGYWQYPTRSDREPKSELPPGGANSANKAGDGFVSPPLPVGSYTRTASTYGAHDMAGNVNDWTESWFEGDAMTEANTRRMIRGGQYIWQGDHAHITYRWGTHRKVPGSTEGFRVAAVALGMPPVLESAPWASPNPVRLGP